MSTEFPEVDPLAGKTWVEDSHHDDEAEGDVGLPPAQGYGEIAGDHERGDLPAEIEDAPADASLAGEE